MASESCIFCRIVRGELPSQVVYRDDEVTAFQDIQPAAPIHVLVVPNRHIASLDAAQPEDALLLGTLLQTAAQVARQVAVDDGGYRVVINTGPDAGESVPHIHVHLLGGRSMGWPPG